MIDPVAAWPNPIRLEGLDGLDTVACEAAGAPSCERYRGLQSFGTKVLLEVILKKTKT